MSNPFIQLLSSVVSLYTFCVIAWAVLATLISFQVVNAYQPVVQRVMFALNRLCEPALRRIRRYMPDLGGIDLSPIVLLLLLQFVQNMLYRYF